MAETVGILNVEIKGKLDQLDRNLRTAETKALSSAKKMEQGFENAFKVAKIFGALSSLAAGFKLVDAATMAWKGNLAGASEILKTLPFGIGEAARAAGDLYLNLSGLQKTLDDAKAGAAAARSDTEFARKGRTALDRLQDQIELAQAPDAKARERVTIEQEYRGLKKLAEEQTDLRGWGFGKEIGEAADKLRMLKLKAIDPAATTTPRRVESLSAAGVGLRVAGVNREPADKRGQDKANSYLQTMVQLLRAQAGVAVAG